jgi:hypothetical protein
LIDRIRLAERRMTKAPGVWNARTNKADAL